MSRRKGKTLVLIFDAVVFILLEVAAFHLLRREGQLQGMWLGAKAHAVSGEIWGTTEQLRYYFSLKRQNEELASSSLALMERLNACEKELSDRRSARQSEEIAKSRDFRYIPASIVKISRNRQHNYLILDKGSEDGVTPRCGIVTPCGVIGIVDAVSLHRSYAISLMNTDMFVSCRLGVDGAMGTLSWDGIKADGALLSGIPLHAELHPGDTVYTSGVSSMFPADIPLGVTGESRIADGATSEIKVRLFQDFSTLRYVAVVRNLRQAETEALEEAYEKEKEAAK